MHNLTHKGAHTKQHSQKNPEFPNQRTKNYINKINNWQPPINTASTCCSSRLQPCRISSFTANSRLLLTSRCSSNHHQGKNKNKTTNLTSLQPASPPIFIAHQRAPSGMNSPSLLPTATTQQKSDWKLQPSSSLIRPQPSSLTQTEFFGAFLSMHKPRPSNSNTFKPSSPCLSHTETSKLTTTASSPATAESWTSPHRRESRSWFLKCRHLLLNSSYPSSDLDQPPSLLFYCPQRPTKHRSLLHFSSDGHTLSLSLALPTLN